MSEGSKSQVKEVVKRLQAFITAIPVGVVFCSLDQGAVYGPNTKMLQLIGCSAKEFTKRSVRDIFVSQLADSELLKFLRDCVGKKCQAQIRTDQGNVIGVEFTTNNYGSMDSETLILCFIETSTELAKLE